jgi:hypothetical protein
VDDEDAFPTKHVSVSTVLEKGSVGLYMLYENVTDARKQPGYVNEVSVKARREGDGATKIPFRRLSVSRPDLAFAVEVASKKLCDDPMRRFSTPLGTIRNIEGRRGRIDTARVVFRIITDIPKPLEEDVNVLLNLSYRIQPKVKADRDGYRKYLFARH